MRNLVSIDFGQSQDFTALAIAEQLEGDGKPRLVVRHLHRFPLGTSYVAIISEVKRMLDDPRLRDAVVLVDATGVGRAVLDLMNESDIRPVAVTITGGTNETSVGEHWSVPKKNLVSSVSTMLETRRLKVADDLEFGSVLRHELANFKAKISTSGNTSFEAWRESDHDDLVIAVALACWWSGIEAGKPTFSDVMMAFGVYPKKGF